MHSEQDLSTRKLILTLLKTSPRQSVNDLARQIGITEMAVRRHLHTLERDHMVRTELVRQAMGRPLKLYSLTVRADEMFPKNYHKFTLEILEELDKEDSAWLSKVFERRRDKMLKQYRREMKGHTLEERIQELTRIQNAGGYMAEWEKCEDGSYELREYNCPISQVAASYQQACDCELSLFQSLLNARVDRKECLASEGLKCLYTISSLPEKGGQV